VSQSGDVETSDEDNAEGIAPGRGPEIGLNVDLRNRYVPFKVNSQNTDGLPEPFPIYQESTTPF
jgi:hypothetical protein